MFTWRVDTALCCRVLTQLIGIGAWSMLLLKAVLTSCVGLIALQIYVALSSNKDANSYYWKYIVTANCRCQHRLHKFACQQMHRIDFSVSSRQVTLVTYRRNEDWRILLQALSDWETKHVLSLATSLVEYFLQLLILLHLLFELV